MRKIYMVFFFLAFSTSALAEAEYYAIDPEHSFPHFAIDHLGLSTMYGRFDQTTGRLMIDRQRKTGFIDIKIAAVSITTGFAKRDKHLRSPDFLNVMEFPNIIYKSRNISFGDNSTAFVEGDLTMLGITKPVPLNVNRMRCGKNPISQAYTCGFEASAEIKRSDFGSKFGLPNIGDTMKLWFEVEAIREN